MNHHSDSLVSIEISLTVKARKSEKTLLSISNTALAYKPPRRLGSKPQAHDQRQRPDPLQTIRDSVSPLVSSADHRSQDSNADFLSETPAEVDVCGEITSEGD